MITLTVRDPDGYVVVEKTQKNNRTAGEPVTIPSPSTRRGCGAPPRRTSIR